MSLTLADSVSGNLMSKATNRSPFRLGSFGNGRPWPWSRFTVVGLTISFVRLMGIFSPVRVGTSSIVPQSAWKFKPHLVCQNTTKILSTLKHLQTLSYITYKGCSINNWFFVSPNWKKIKQHFIQNFFLTGISSRLAAKLKPFFTVK